MHESVLVPDVPRVMLVDERLHVSPVVGLTVVARFTEPANPFTPVTTTVDVPTAPALVVTVEGLTLTVKS